MRIGLLHPGEMGAAIGAVLTGAGHHVAWASEGRSAETAARAAAAGLVDAGGVAALVADSELILSVCPPHAALEVAELVAGAGSAGTGSTVAGSAGAGSVDAVYVDANAVSPQTTRTVGERFARFVDGGIVGPPPTRPGVTRLYLSGPDAAAVAEVFAGTFVDAIVVPGEAGQASAVKMAYAAWTKGSGALLLAVRETARAAGVEEELLDAWRAFQPQLLERWEGALDSATNKGWRWIAEMDEIADTFAAAGQPEGFHRAAAELYRGYPRPTAG
jgi:3-hydroxyisobutyrate dehydrogenase-like beta-hydroxyacid dehydrogenase